jgi:DNA (cytosine-5-)-methyltransferase
MLVSAVDLFCGIGGLTHGLQLANIPVVVGIDVEPSCQYAYEQNNDARFILKDITQLTGRELNNYFTPHTTKVLVGCAPCQPFSTYSLRYKKHREKDNKWRLLYYFANLTEDVLPEILSMENVPQLVHEKVFKDFFLHLKNLGYHCSWEIVNCADYGVPQCRKRLVLLASLLGDIKMIPPIYDEKNHRTVRDAIGSLPPIEDGGVDPIDSLHRSSRLSVINKKRMNQSVPGGSWKDWDDDLRLACHKRSSGKGYQAVYGRMEWDKPSPTITTQYYGYGNGRFGHPEQNRALSMREGALLQSFPPNYQFVNPGHSENNRSIGVHIGNAVPVELGRAIGIAIADHLSNLGRI